MASQSPLLQWHISSNVAKPIPMKPHLLIVTLPMSLGDQLHSNSHTQYTTSGNLYKGPDSLTHRYFLSHIIMFLATLLTIPIECARTTQSSHRKKIHGYQEEVQRRMSRTEVLGCEKWENHGN